MNVSACYGNFVRQAEAETTVDIAKKKTKKKLAIAIPQHFLCLLLMIPAFSYRQDYALLVIISDNVFSTEKKPFCHLYPGV